MMGGVAGDALNMRKAKPRLRRSNIKTMAFFCLLCPVQLLNGEVGSDERPDSPGNGIQLDPISLIELTYRHNLQIAASRYEMEAAVLEFDRFERNLSQFIPFIAESEVERAGENFIRGPGRISETETQVKSTVGVEKEFFDGTKISAGAGGRASFEEGEEIGNPFVEAELEIPLFSSFTRLERIIDRSFEESEMLEAWLDFIEQVEESVEESQESYFSLQRLKNRRDIALGAVKDLKSVLVDAGESMETNDRLQIQDQIQDFQSEAVEFQGEMGSRIIELLDNIGLDDLKMERVKFLNYRSEADFYGSHYLETPVEVLIRTALENDVEIRILEIAKGNSELKKRLALEGKWDIIGRLFGTLDFKTRGDDPTEKREYFAGVALDVKRNDPRLLSLDRRQAEAEIRRFESAIEFRKRELRNAIRRRVIQASSLKDVLIEVQRGLDSRRAVYEQKRADYLSGKETVDNLLTARISLLQTEADMIEVVDNFYEEVIELDTASGFYFYRLANELEALEASDSFDFKISRGGHGVFPE